MGEGQIEEANRLEEVAEKLQVCLTNQDEAPEEVLVGDDDKQKQATPVKEQDKDFVDQQLDSVIGTLKEEGDSEMVELVEKVENAFKDGVQSKNTNDTQHD